MDDHSAVVEAVAQFQGGAENQDGEEVCRGSHNLVDSPTYCRQQGSAENQVIYGVACEC